MAGESQEEFDKRTDFNQAMDKFRESIAAEKKADAELIADANRKQADGTR
jgi:hypothetical protein